MTGNRFFAGLISLVASLTASAALAAGPTKINSCQLILTPGAYIVTDNLTTGVPGLACLDINASDVTINLNGFQMDGTASNTEAINVASGFGNIVIRNGTIRGYSNGVVFAGKNFMGRIQGLRLVDNSGAGIFTNGSEAMIIRGNIITGSIAPLTFDKNSIVEGNIVVGNSGVMAGDCDSVIRGNVDAQNIGFPLVFGAGTGTCITSDNAID
jgi:hypothetical protein